MSQRLGKGELWLRDVWNLTSRQDGFVAALGQALSRRGVCAEPLTLSLRRKGPRQELRCHSGCDCDLLRAWSR